MVIRSAAVDDNAKVKQCVTTKLIPEWLRQYDNNYLQLIKAVRLDGDEKDIKTSTKVVEYILNCLFRCVILCLFVAFLSLYIFSTKPLTEIMTVITFNDSKIPFDDLNWDTVIYWRCLVQYLRKSDQLEGQLNSILSEVIIPFCNYIQE